MNYSEKDLVRIAKRENNKKRKFLVVDPLQGKHVPVEPAKALQLFDDLASLLRGEYTDEKILIIGFAETATAIGAQTAISLGTDYIQTTRENVEGADYLFFSEEHSHATEQRLVKNDIDAAIADIDRIIFVEDEVTTGKTILNIISVLKKTYSDKIKFSVASLLNAMADEDMKVYHDNDIDVFYLVKTDHTGYDELAESYAGNGKYYECDEEWKTDIPSINVNAGLNSRRLVSAEKYTEACEKIWEEASKLLEGIKGKKILVVGTEEFMYPALYIGAKIQRLGNEVRCHSTTRSPITVSMEDGYPLHSRYSLCSLYDAERKTFIYDIDEYDKVFIITDAPESEKIALATLVNALKHKNNDICLIRWY